MLNEASSNALYAETLQDICCHTLNLMNSTYPSAIWEKSSASYARVLAKNYVSAWGRGYFSFWSEPNACAAFGCCYGTKCPLYLVLFFFWSEKSVCAALRHCCRIKCPLVWGLLSQPKSTQITIWLNYIIGLLPHP